MKRVADNFYKVEEFYLPTPGVSIKMMIDLIDSEYLDSEITLSGKFTVGGSERTEFVKDLGALVDKYRI